MVRTLTAGGDALGGGDLVAVRLQGWEGVDGLFEYVLTVKTPDARNFVYSGASDFELDGFIGKAADVGIELADPAGGRRWLNGLVTEARFLREEGRSAFYELTLKPWLHLATLKQDCRIFQDKTVVEVLDEVLGIYGHPVEKRLTGSYPKRDYQTQYNETDFKFFERLCEEWGISYCFEHEEGIHRLVLVDEMPAWKKNPNGRYREIKFHYPDEQAEEEYIDALVPGRRIVSGRYQTRDYDYTRPKADLTVTQAAPRETAHNAWEIYAWHEGVSGGSHYAQPKAGPNQAANEAITEGDALALLRMQAIRSRGWRAGGGGNLRGLVPGCTFTLKEHPSNAANREYLTLWTALLIEEIAQETQKGQGKETPSDAAGQKTGLREQQWQVRVDFELHPMQEAYRVEPRHAKPVVPGPEVALVVGPEGENLWTDELGRIKVQFYWDRYGKKDQNAGCWLRVSVPWAGNQSGSQQLPRIGQEVLVSYLGGDPDLPVVTGRVHNQDNQPPWSLPGQQALSGMRSRELVEGGGNAASGQSNALILDDTPGKIQAKLRSDHLGSELSLGYVTRIEDHEGRKDGRGEGFDLRTDGHGVMRAGSGLYVSTRNRRNGQGPMKAMEETVQRLEAAKGQQETLAEVADTFEADFGEQKQVAEKLGEANEGIKGEGETDEGSGKFPELAEAHLVLASARGLHGTSEGTTHLLAGEHLALTSGEHVSLSVGKRLLASVTDGIRYFVRQAGMKVIAAADDIDIKALKDNLNLFAKLDMTQSANKIILKAKEEILLVGGGSYLKINGSTIENGTSGKWAAHAASHLFVAPKSMNAALPELPKVGEGQLDLFSHYTKPYGLKNAPYKVVDALGKEVEGTLDGSGRFPVSGLALGPAKVYFGEDPTDTWNMEASHIGEPEWPPRELEEMADVGAFGGNPLAPLSAAARTALDAAAKAAAEVGQNLRQIDQLLPRIPSLDTLLPQGGALDKLEGLGNTGIGQEAVRRMAGVEGRLASIAGALSGAGRGGPVLPDIAGRLALPGSLPSPSALPKAVDSDHLLETMF
jgi:type VI secretion system secreted protein VgrG